MTRRLAILNLILPCKRQAAAGQAEPQFCHTKTAASLILSISAAAGALGSLMAGCQPRAPQGSLVLTQTPASAARSLAATVLDLRYPLGSGVALASPPYGSGAVRALSQGLAAAGDVAVSADGQRVYFAGKAAPNSEWQIYEANASGGRPRRVTKMPGGAMDPACAAHHILIFSSPVPRLGETWRRRQPSALYAQAPGEAPRRITFGPDSAIDPTVLRDGRILFVTAQARDDRRLPPHLALFTVNADGAEVTAYACQDDGADFIRRPRELADGRIAVLASRLEAAPDGMWAECVRAAAPFASRTNLFAWPEARCRSVESLPNGDLFACLDRRGLVGRSMAARTALFVIAPNSVRLSGPLFEDAARNVIEAVPMAPRPRPMGHPSALRAGFSTGTILCLNANDSSDRAAARRDAPAARLRVLALTKRGVLRALGEAPVQPDGSVMAELPADTPLGFDTLDAAGHRLRHQPPFLWVRPGENRACVGCHEARNHAPRNVRPLAIAGRAPRLDFPTDAIASSRSPR